MGQSSAERQRAFRKRMAEFDRRPVNVIVPASMAGAIAALARRLCEDPDLEIGPLRNTRTGRLEKL